MYNYYEFINNHYNKKKILFFLLIFCVIAAFTACQGRTFDAVQNDYQKASAKPQISLIETPNNTTINVKFDIKIDTFTAQNANYSIVDENGAVLDINSLNVNDLDITFTTSSQAEINYILSVSGIKSKNTITMDPAQISFLGDGIPYIANVSASSDNGSYGTGKEIFIEVKFSETVEVINGTPSLLLETGTSGASALYDSGSGSDTLIFKYTVSSTDNAIALDYSNSQALEPGGGTIQDLSGNEANLTLPSPGEEGSLSYNKALTIDTTSSVTLANPNDGDIFVSNTVGFYGTAFDPGGISTIEIIISYSGNSYTYLATGTDTWSYNASGLPWNTPITIQARMTDVAGYITYSNIISIECQQNLTFGNTVTSIPADETFTFPISYTNFSDPVIIAAVKPGNEGDGTAFTVDGSCAILTGGSNLSNGRFADQGVDGLEENIASAVPRILLDKPGSQFRVKVLNTDINCPRSVTEDIWYFMVEANVAGDEHYTLSNGGELEAGNFILEQAAYKGNTNYPSTGDNGFKTISFLKTFSSVPIVFVQQISDNNSNYVNLKINNVKTTTFDIAFHVDEGDYPANDHSADETISYVAIELIEDGGSPSIAGTGSDPGFTHWYGTELFNGKNFQVGRITGFNAWNETSGPTNTKDISLQSSYTNPLVFLNMNTDTGGNASYARVHGIRNDPPTVIEAYVEDTQSRSHNGEETFVYFVIEE